MATSTTCYFVIGIASDISYRLSPRRFAADVVTVNTPLISISADRHVPSTSSAMFQCTNVTAGLWYRRTLPSRQASRFTVICQFRPHRLPIPGQRRAFTLFSACIHRWPIAAISAQLHRRRHFSRTASFFMIAFPVRQSLQQSTGFIALARYAAGMKSNIMSYHASGQIAPTAAAQII